MEGGKELVEGGKRHYALYSCEALWRLMPWRQHLLFAMLVALIRTQRVIMLLRLAHFVLHVGRPRCRCGPPELSLENWSAVLWCVLLLLLLLVVVVYAVAVAVAGDVAVAGAVAVFCCDVVCSYVRAHVFCGTTPMTCAPSLAATVDALPQSACN